VDDPIQSDLVYRLRRLPASEADKQIHGSGASFLQVNYTYADGSDNNVRLEQIDYPNTGTGGREIDLGYGSADGQDDILSRVANVEDPGGSATILANGGFLHGGVHPRDFIFCQAP